MIKVELTYDEYFVIKSIFDRVEKQRKRVPKKRKWIKQDGMMINAETGMAIDTLTNKPVLPLVAKKLPDLIESEVKIDE